MLDYFALLLRQTLEVSYIRHLNVGCYRCRFGDARRKKAKEVRLGRRDVRHADVQK
jgi:hypothetical protein